MPVAGDSERHDYLERWSYDGTLDRIHHALYVECREQREREASQYFVAMVDGPGCLSRQGTLRSRMGILRSAAVDASFLALRLGLSWPRSEAAAKLDQWSQLFKLVRRLKINVFVDVGASRGNYSRQLRRGGYRGLLCSFEPVPADYAILKTLAARDPQWIVRNHALGDKECVEQFNVNSFDRDQTTMSSFLTLREPWRSTITVPVQIKRLDAELRPIIDPISSPRIFLKMDTQGFDKRVFDGAAGCLDKIIGIQSELSVTPLYEEMPHFTESLRYYESFGFSLMDLFVASRTRDGRVVEYDCLLAKPSSFPHLDARHY